MEGMKEKNMKRVCPNFPESHLEFEAPVKITETWLVDGNGKCLNLQSSTETKAYPNLNSRWYCLECGYPAVDPKKVSKDRPYTSASGSFE